MDYTDENMIDIFKKIKGDKSGKVFTEYFADASGSFFRKEQKKIPKKWGSKTGEK